MGPIFASVVSALVAGVFSQASVPAEVPTQLRDHLRAETFQVVTSIRGLPLGVRDELEKRFGNGLDIAEPGAEYQASDVVGDRKLPIRRLVTAGCSMDHCLVHYERGGYAHVWQV